MCFFEVEIKDCYILAWFKINLNILFYSSIRYYTNIQWSIQNNVSVKLKEIHKVLKKSHNDFWTKCPSWDALPPSEGGNITARGVLIAAMKATRLQLSHICRTLWPVNTNPVREYKYTLRANSRKCTRICFLDYQNTNDFAIKSEK